MTDIARSKDFYGRLLGTQPAADFSDQAGDPAVHEDPARIYGGCVFSVGDQLLGLRPVASAGRPLRVHPGRARPPRASPSVQQRNCARQPPGWTRPAVEHGEVTELAGFGIAILSVQDPDDINLELTAPLPA